MARLFTTSRWLRKYGSKKGHQVFIRIRMRNGVETEIPVYDYVDHTRLPISVKKEHWTKGYITGGKYHKTVRDLNNLLTKIEADVKDAVNELLEKNVKVTRENLTRLTYINEDTFLENERKIKKGEIIVNEDGGAFASQDEFEEYVKDSDDPKFNELKKQLGGFKKEYILDYWSDFLKDYAPDSYNASHHSIEEYITLTGDNCKASEFSSPWLERFFSYIIENGFSIRKDGQNRKPYTITTVKKYHKHLTSFGDFLFHELKILGNQEYRRFSLVRNTKKKSLVKYDPDPYANAHALYKREFDWFYGFNFQDKKLATIRDMFILQVWLGGLRQSDFYGISEINFHKDSTGAYKVWFEQQKTDDNVLNVVNQNYLIPILEKYPNGFTEFPKVHIYNPLLKKAAEEAGLNRMVMFRHEIITKTQPDIKWYPIHEKITNKWARCCAVSILAELGYPDDRISKFTGHKDLEMIRHYKAIHQKDINMMMQEVKPEVVTKL